MNQNIPSKAISGAYWLMLQLALIACGCLFSGAVWANPPDNFSAIRFSAMDLNEDGVLLREEVVFADKEVGFWLDGQGWGLTDANRSFSLDLAECIRSEAAAESFRLRQEQTDLKRMQAEIPFFDKMKPVYLSRQPQVAGQLFSNLSWTDTHTSLIQYLLRDQIWWRKYPEPLLALHQNFSWLWRHPDLARKLYRIPLPPGAPQALIRWRSLHENYLTQLPEVKSPGSPAEVVAAPPADFMALLETYQAEAKKREDSLVQVIASGNKNMESLRVSLNAAQADLAAARQTLSLLEAGRGGEQVSLAGTVTRLERALRQKTEEIRLAMVEEDSLLAENYRIKHNLRAMTPAQETGSTNYQLSALNEELRALNEKLLERENRLKSASTLQQQTNDRIRQLEISMDSLRTASSTTALTPAAPLPSDLPQAEARMISLQEKMAALEADNALQQALSQKALNEAQEWKKIAELTQNQFDSLAVVSRQPAAAPNPVSDRTSHSSQQPLSDSLRAARIQVNALEQRVSAWEQEKKLRQAAENRAQLAEMRNLEMEKQLAAQSAKPLVDPALVDAFVRIQRLEFVLRQTLEELEKYRIQQPEKPAEPDMPVVATELEPQVGYQAVLERYHQQESQLQAQLKNNNLYLAKVVTEKKSLESELAEAAKVQTQLSRVIDSLNKIAVYRQNRLATAVDSVRYYRSLSRKNAALAQSWQSRYADKQITTGSSESALRSRIESLEAELAASQSSEKVDVERLLVMEQTRFALEKKELELRQLEAKLNQQQNWLANRTQELEATALKYQDLQEKEKQLKLMEQRIKQTPPSSTQP